MQTRNLARAGAAKSRRLYLIWNFSRTYLYALFVPLCLVLRRRMQLIRVFAVFQAHAGDQFSMHCPGKPKLSSRISSLDRGQKNHRAFAAMSLQSADEHSCLYQFETAEPARTTTETKLLTMQACFCPATYWGNGRLQIKILIATCSKLEYIEDLKTG